MCVGGGLRTPPHTGGHEQSPERSDGSHPHSGGARAPPSSSDMEKSIYSSSHKAVTEVSAPGALGPISTVSLVARHLEFLGAGCLCVETDLAQIRPDAVQAWVSGWRRRGPHCKPQWDYLGRPLQPPQTCPAATQVPKGVLNPVHSPEALVQGLAWS